MSRPPVRLSKTEEDVVNKDHELTYAGLIGIGVVFVQQYIAMSTLDVASRVCIVAFAVAIPLLGFLIMLKRIQAVAQYTSQSRFVSVIQSIAILGGSVGVVAAFWHLMWVAGVVVLVSGLLGFSVYTAYWSRLYLERGLFASAVPAPDQQARGNSPEPGQEQP